MCTNYTPATPTHLLNMAELGVQHWPAPSWPPETYPGYPAPIVLIGAQGQPVCEVARFGLVPRWCKDASQAGDMARRTYNARSETVAQKPSYRAPWRERQYALVPMADFFEPCWEDAAQHGGKSVRWRIARVDNKPFSAAGLYERWTDRSSGEIVSSFTLLTVNADGHPLMGRMHRVGDEKRSLVIVPPERSAAWLQATPDEAAAMMHTMPVDEWRGAPAPRGAPSSAKSDLPPEKGQLI